MHFAFILLRIKGLYMFQALLAYPQEALHKRHLVYWVRIMLETCRGSWFSKNWMKSASRWFHYTEVRYSVFYMHQYKQACSQKSGVSNTLFFLQACLHWSMSNTLYLIYNRLPWDEPLGSKHVEDIKKLKIKILFRKRAFCWLIMYNATFKHCSCLSHALSNNSQDGHTQWGHSSSTTPLLAEFLLTETSRRAYKIKWKTKSP
jgi:hypothetical protein